MPGITAIGTAAIAKIANGVSVSAIGSTESSG
jgi:hypothetical protein